MTRCGKIEGERVAVSGTAWRAACERIRTTLATEMSLAGCDVEIDVHKLPLYDRLGHFDTRAESVRRVAGHGERFAGTDQ